MGRSTGESRKGRSCQTTVEGGLCPGPFFLGGMKMLGEHLWCHGNCAYSDWTSGRAWEPALGT